MIIKENIPRITGDKIILSLFRTDDEAAQKYAAWMSEESVSAYIEKSGVVVDSAYMAGWLLSCNPYRMGIVEKETGELIGYCHIDHRAQADAAWLSVNIGEPAARGKHYGTEIVTLLTKFAFEELGVESVHADILETNKPSLRCCEKVGFKVSGRYRKHYIHEGKRIDWLHVDMIRDEWEALHS